MTRIPPPTPISTSKQARERLPEALYFKPKLSPPRAARELSNYGKRWIDHLPEEKPPIFRCGGSINTGVEPKS
jgi:hypothetical protein